MNSFDIIAFGHILNETIVFPGKEIKAVLGSPPAYAMVAAARLKANVGIVTNIGLDFPKKLLKPIFDSGVDPKGIIQKGNFSTTNQLVYREDGSKEITFLKKAPDIIFQDIPKEYLNAKLFYICPMDFEVSLSVVKELKNLGKLMALDIGGYGGAHSAVSNAKKDFEFTKELVSCFNIVKASDEDCRRLSGDKNIDIEKMAQRFLTWGASSVIITLGDKGSLLLTKKHQFQIPAFKANVKDTTGAGDVFMAGFLTYYLRTKDIEKSGVFASAAASLCIENTGGVSVERMPTMELVRKRINHE